MKRLPQLRFLPAILLAAGLLPAQSHEILSTGNGQFPANGNFELLVAGNFLGTLVPSAVVVRSGLPYLLLEPALYRRVLPLENLSGVTGAVAFGASNLAVPRFDGDLDVLLVTTGAGATLLRFDPLERTFLRETVLTSTIGAPWAGASLLTARQQAGSGNVILAGRSTANGILIGCRNGAGGLTHLVRTPGTALPIHEIKLLDWDHDGALDVVATTQAGIFACRIDGTPLPSIALPIDAIRSAPVETAGVAELASVTSSMSSPTFARVDGTPASGWRLQPLATGGLQLADQVPVWAEGRDTHGDGAYELLYSRRGSLRPVLVDAAGGHELPLLQNLSGDPTRNRCPFVWQDLDGDGDLDGLFAFDSPRVIAFRPNLQLHPGPSGPTFDVQVPEEPCADETIAYGQFHGTVDGLYKVLELTIRRTHAGSASRLDLLVWHQSNPLLNPSIDRLIDSQHIQLPPGTDPFQIQIRLDAPVVNSFYFSHADHFYLDLRFVDVVRKKVIYYETDGLTIAHVHPPEDPSELQAFNSVEYRYLAALQVTPGRVSTIRGIYDYPHVPGDQPCLRYASHTWIGEIFTRVVTPPINQIPL